jgi:hypothetical protein
MVERLKSDETALKGGILIVGGRVEWDDVTRRIHELTQDTLVLLGTTDAGWTRLYRDPGDGRLWELTFPQSEIQGGGPPALAVLTAEEAAKRYDSVHEG